MWSSSSAYSGPLKCSSSRSRRRSACGQRIMAGASLLVAAAQPADFLFELLLDPALGHEDRGHGQAKLFRHLLAGAITQGEVEEDLPVARADAELHLPLGQFQQLAVEHLVELLDQVGMRLCLAEDRQPKVVAVALRSAAAAVVVIGPGV